MNTNPKAKTVVCFGDSDTYGASPDKSGRYPANVRWTGQLQDLLGDDYYLIEEGLNGRVTNFDPDGRDDRNGLVYLKQMAYGQTPIDYFVLMLGVNDCRERFGRSAQEITDALEQLIEVVYDKSFSSDGSKPKIILMSTPPVDYNAERFAELFGEDYGAGGDEKSRELAETNKALADRLGIAHIDLGKVAEFGEDGLHFTKESNAKIAERIELEIKR